MGQESAQRYSSQGGSHYYDEQQLSMLSVRLDTKQMLEKFELFLRGERIIEKMTPQGHIILTKERNEAAMPKANERGINDIMSFLHANVNPQTVQGNMSNDEYISHITSIHHRLNEALFLNFYEWELTVGNYQMIISTLIPQLKAFYTRLKDNLERESYIPMMKTVETYSHNEQQRNVLGLKSNN